jgi:Rrf2 family protein
MKITRRTDYAVHLLAEFAEGGGRPQGLRNLSEKHEVTYAFARTVQCGLLKSGIIKTARGINGGILLARSLEEITLLEVFEAAQGPLETVFASGETPWCGCGGEFCPADETWKEIRGILREKLSALTLQSILEKAEGGESCSE